MGFHTCKYCQEVGEKDPARSSGDVTMEFSSGRSYVAPDMLPHYVEQHDFQPPEHFVQDVTQGKLIAGARLQTRSIQPRAEKERIGYLDGEYPEGPVPAGFVEKLQRVMELAADLGLNHRGT